jgi:hypothetical protein
LKECPQVQENTEISAINTKLANSTSFLFKIKKTQGVRRNFSTLQKIHLVPMLFKFLPWGDQGNFCFKRAKVFLEHRVDLFKKSHISSKSQPVQFHQERPVGKRNEKI